MFAAALVGAALLIGAAGPAAVAQAIGSATQGAGSAVSVGGDAHPVAADDEAPKETTGRSAGGGAGKALAAPALL